MRSTLVALALLAGCTHGTGGDRFEFVAAAAGPADATGSLAFTTGRGDRIVLEKALVRIRALYLNQSVALSAPKDTHCFLHGIYAAQVTSGRTIDLLSSAPQFFGVLGEATRDVARTGEVWLGSVPIDAPDDPVPVVELAGRVQTAGRPEARFEAIVSIGSNRAIPAPRETPGAFPICRERIVSPIPIELPLARGGDLLLRIDPRPWFAAVDFATVPEDPDGVLRFPDVRGEQASNALFNGIKARAGVYHFEWTRLREGDDG
jgi:hypothetical protein